METLEECERVVVDHQAHAHCTGVALAGCPILLATGSLVGEIFGSRYVRTWLSGKDSVLNTKAKGRNEFAFFCVHHSRD